VDTVTGSELLLACLAIVLVAVGVIAVIWLMTSRRAAAAEPGHVPRPSAPSSWDQTW
jgi:hypothetical protein